MKLVLLSTAVLTLSLLSTQAASLFIYRADSASDFVNGTNITNLGVWDGMDSSNVIAVAADSTGAYLFASDGDIYQASSIANLTSSTGFSGLTNLTNGGTRSGLNPANITAVAADDTSGAFHFSNDDSKVFSAANMANLISGTGLVDEGTRFGLEAADMVGMSSSAVGTYHYYRPDGSLYRSDSLPNMVDGSVVFLVGVPQIEGTQLAAAEVVAMAADAGGVYILSTVPEPTSLGLLGVTAFLLLARRNQRK